MSKGNELAQRVKEAVEQMNATVRAVKHDFETFIVDTTVPLDERFEVWTDAPNELKNHQGWIVHFKTLHDDAIGYDGYIRHADRHETVHIDDLLDAIQDGFADYEAYKEEPPTDESSWEYRYFKKKEKIFEEFDLAAFKEEVLSMNLGSFEYDW